MLSNPMASLAAKQASKDTANKKIIWVVLRGAMDSLHAVVPIGDPDLFTHRKTLVQPIADQLLPLNKYFGLHPSFTHMHQWYQQGQMLPIVAVASPYRSRSHFDAQDMLESGLTITDHESGWLARAFAHYQGEALAISRSLPISMRGTKTVRTWYPSALPDVEQDLYDRLASLYANDAIFSARLKEGLETKNMLSMEGNNKKNPKFLHLAKNCGELLANNRNANCAMLEMGGWDTHNAQVNRLKRQFTELDNSLKALRDKLGSEWNNTVVIVATEFGRTVKVNGTKGTDHGTASAMFMAGGAVAGGKVLGQWPGLSQDKLYQQRDLQPTSDIRQWLATLLQQHWHLSTHQLNSIFPKVGLSKQRLINA